jgi:hypothetical protein
MCLEENVALDRKGILASMIYTLLNLQRTPVILVNGQLASQGRVPTLEELRGWLRVARSPKG